MKTLKIFPRKLIVTLRFKSGNTLKFACDTFNFDNNGWKVKGLMHTMYDGNIGYLDVDSIESMTAFTRRILKIYKVTE